MILDAVLLMVVGMGTVFLFLVLLNIGIAILTKFNLKHAKNEEEENIKAQKALRAKKNKKTSLKKDNKKIVAVISAAIKAHTA